MRVWGIWPFALLIVAPGCAAPSSGTPRPVTVVPHEQAPVLAERVLPSDERRALDRTLERYLRQRPGRASVAVYNKTTGVRYAFRERTPYMLASVAKVDILLAFLLDKQRQGRQVTAYEHRLADRMIRNSDNDCAHELYMTIGGQDGLDQVLRRLGIQHTRPGPDLSWGSTRSRPSDQVKVLEQLTDPGGPLSARHRRYALKLMSSVAPEQAWGVSAASGEVALKNGWLPAQVHGGLWTINSVGRLRVRGHDLLIAVLSERSPDMETGVATVGHLAEVVAGALTRAETTVQAAS
ncbi:beta-lactamase class A [Nonomuraea polychroma]|uniref:Beta-lactamase class A n=1 Tax=Nonomuraea polychroma TaxID=46176 RepID=A0A438MDL5_9ACTN|nr:serine hydrolase [Nonomuraea polychroma]RVX43625.1 beta-lactamase class A [Nonomuraea polychroma]